MTDDNLAQVHPLENADETIQQLLKESKLAYAYSYSPYSSACVGAAILCHDGNIIKGCNVENCSYGLSICAERNAICAAVARGYCKFKAIAISSNIKDLFISPCGACRQFMIEFGTTWDVYMTDKELNYRKATVSELLPFSFVPEYLKK
ncbi:cytidine deaminase-like [Centruroides sculpturatus]|uniref:cytidine deaminase-like n=1 Tax=Centruroides sculpturatus TaxID=218467 RepID=UPI000C6CE05E|nr:cytidine deaminase-like [Centruroides sculpturatus]